MFSGVFLLVKCSGAQKEKKDPEQDKFSEFAGSQKCAGCHKDIYASHLHTEHFQSSAPVTAQNILGNLEKGKNRFFFDPITYVAVEKRDSGIYQVQYIYDEEEKKVRMDIVVGSGRKGQSYLSWNGNKLVQLPVTFFTPANQWSTSPGYPANKVVYNRPISSRCLECHSTYFEKTSGPQPGPEDFDRQKIIYGIDCEKCHGPAAMHVQFQTQNPRDKQAKFIINPSKLSRQQNLDLCALCHGGRLSKTKPSFTFQAGDTLANYFNISSNPVDAADIDVHGNQFGLLSASKCFTLSQMTCISCHNTHRNEKDQLAMFSQKCMTCHTAGQQKWCKLTETIGPVIKQNCIDCHMPKMPSKTIAVNLQGRDTLTPVLMRNHRIKIYPGETDKVWKELKKI